MVRRSLCILALIAAGLGADCRVGPPPEGPGPPHVGPFTAYYGTWTGSATSAPGTKLPPTFTLTIHLRSGRIGEVVGDFVRSDPFCAGRLVADSRTGSGITVSVAVGPEGSGAGCTAGARMALTVASGSLHVQWFSSPGPGTAIAVATLVRQGQ